jgi:hypothetical protein
MVLAGHSPLLGSIALGGNPLIRAVRARRDVELIEVNERSRERLVGEILSKLIIED